MAKKKEDKGHALTRPVTVGGKVYKPGDEEAFYASGIPDEEVERLKGRGILRRSEGTEAEAE